MPRRLSIQIESRKARPNARTVMAGLGQCLGAVYGPDADLSQVRVLGISMNSPLTLTLEGPATASDPFVKAASDLQKGTAGAKRIALDVLRRIESLRNAISDGITGIQVISGGRRARVDASVVEAAATMLRQAYVPQFREEDGQIDGIMEAIFAPGEKRMFRLRDRLTGRTIECSITQQEFSKAKDALPGRVLVTGRIRYNDQGQPTSVSVTSLQAVPDRKISWRGWQPVNITDGKDAAEYIRELRNA